MEAPCYPDTVTGTLPFSMECCHQQFYVIIFRLHNSFGNVTEGKFTVNVTMPGHNAMLTE